jgi:hypothetical protein
MTGLFTVKITQKIILNREFRKRHQNMTDLQIDDTNLGVLFLSKTV